MDPARCRARGREPVPWCDHCSRFWNPNSMRSDGSCPTCGEVLADPAEGRAPWHFKLLLVGVALYLGWRGWEGVLWLLDRVG